MTVTTDAKPSKATTREADLEHIDLRALAELSAPERAFLSFYGSGPSSIQSLDDRARRIRSLLAGNDAKLEHFERSLELLKNELPTNGDFGEAAGFAVFACWALDFVRRYPLPVAPHDALWIDTAPCLRPLAELQDEYIPFVVVARAAGRRSGISAGARTSCCTTARRSQPGSSACTKNNRSSGWCCSARWRSWARSRRRCRRGSPPVDTMIVRRDARIAGMRCRDCELLAVAKPQQCPACKSNDVFAVDLVNELVQLLAVTSARAEFSDPLPGLEEVGDVAALLRW